MAKRSAAKLTRDQLRRNKWLKSQLSKQHFLAAISNFLEEQQEAEVPVEIPESERDAYIQTRDILISKFELTTREVEQKGARLYLVEEILDWTIFKRGEKYLAMYLVKWVDYDDPTWNDQHNMIGNPEVDEFWKKVKADPSHRLHQMIKVYNLNDQTVNQS